MGASRRRSSRHSYFGAVATREARAADEARATAERAAHVAVLADVLEQLAVGALDAAAVARVHRVLEGVGGDHARLLLAQLAKRLAGARPISDEVLAFHARGLADGGALGNRRHAWRRSSGSAGLRSRCAQVGAAFGASRIEVLDHEIRRTLVGPLAVPSLTLRVLALPARSAR